MVLGIPYFDSNQSAWADVATSKSCANIAVDVNTCEGTLFVGKQMNVALGQLVQQRGLAGAFPWQLNYDTAHANNTLFPYLLQGLTGPAPPLPPRPSAVPMYLPALGRPYIYDNRSAAEAACKTGGFSHLCDKKDLFGHALCRAGWTSDWEGYWMATASSGCGGEGYNPWSGPAGAYCCNGGAPVV